ncbi:serine--tRNA ligase, chloroplastic/mitochondrial-like [Camellia sinensis]|uniref:serine--tRNA ligase, chloroplastic/mitochondrial-like n=1 Tax=Camellia sinensis TaxID=4442 RepID=UPI00103696E7|nr:serine--tRNA ligase, chloroplastic/mitochondrial-like [Camellia sinensis]
MSLQCCLGLGGTTFHTLKLAAIPSSYSSIFRPLSKTLTLDLLLHPHHSPRRPSLPLFARALSAPAIQTTIPEDKVVKPQWKASIDFKWIRDNRVDVAANIRNRHSNADLELVLQLYERLLNVQKVRVLLHLHCFQGYFNCWAICFVDC